MGQETKEAQTTASETGVTAPTPKKEKKKFSLPKSKKGRRWMKIVIVLVLIVGAAYLFLNRAGQNVNSQLSSSYLVFTAQRQDLTVSVSGTATLKPADSYNVTTLITGEIKEAPFEEGDLVTKDTLLYAMDSSDAQTDVQRSSISVAQSRLSYDQAKEAMYPTATLSGTITEMYVHDGDSITAGSPLCKIATSEDLTIDFLFTYADPSSFYVGQSASVFMDGVDGSVQGKVVSVSNSTAVTSNGKESCTVRVRVDNPGSLSASYTASAVIGSYTSYGQAPISMAGASTVYATGSGTVSGFKKLTGSTVTKGETLCTIDSDSTRSALENARLNIQSSQLSVSTASDNLDDYNIKSPIAGTVIEKNFKAGDKMKGTESGIMAVIYDLSYLKTELAVDELDIGKVAVGQSVEITADALTGQTFSGVVDKVSINGTTANGVTTYPVTIVIKDFGDLKPGMNVSAKIIGEEIKDALCIPVDAVSRGNEITVPGEGAMTPDNTAVADITKLETRQVELGRNDEDYIEVTDGLEAGDIVLVNNQATNFMQQMMGG